MKHIQNFRIIFILSLIVIILSATSLIQAQDDAIEFPGEIMAIDGNSISVGGISVDISKAIMPADGLAVGMTVQVIGTRQEQTIIATIVVITDFGTAPEATPLPEATEETQEPEATEEAETPEPATTEEAETPVVIDTSGAIPIIVIEGPVQAINVTSITIFDIDIQVNPADAILTQIRIGDTVRVEGESSFSGNTFIIVAVNITIVQTTVVIIQNNAPGVVYVPVALPQNCKRKKSGKVTCKKSS